MARSKLPAAPAEPAYFRHTEMPAWGVCVLVSRTRELRTYLFADGRQRTFKEAFCEWHIAPAPPPSDEDRARLARGLTAGGKATPKALHLDLEAEIHARPEDPQPYLVYADWLQHRDDPRGKLITIQHQLAQDPTCKPLRDAERTLLAEHGSYLLPESLGPLLRARAKGDDDFRCEVRWAMGFVERVRLARKKQPTEQPTLADIAAQLLDHPSAQFLRGLTLGPLGHADEHDFADIVEAIAAHPRPLLADLFIGDFADKELAFSRAGNLSPLLAAAPALRTLTVRAGSLRFVNVIKHATLRELRLHVAELSASQCKRLLAAKLPALETLELASPGLAVAGPELGGLLGGSSLPRVRRLALRHTIETRAVLEQILRSPLGAQLAAIDLAHGDLTDRDVEALATTLGSQLAALPTLELTGNPLSAAAALRLAKLNPRIAVAGRATRVPASAVAVEDVIAYAPDARSMTAARGIARPERWLELGRDGAQLWGEYEGRDHSTRASSADSRVYYVFARLDRGDSGCTCSSPKDPCKHVLALLLIAAAQHPFAERPIPAAFRRRTYERPRYGAAWE
ncbi:MAG: TIGR02996 domain-containing protein [Myxococcota bacterium]|nr:TIGR02996 domain-containing protein [Myxococcota bacterium]